MKKNSNFGPRPISRWGQRVAANTAELLAEKYDVILVIFTHDDKLFETKAKIVNLNYTK